MGAGGPGGSTALLEAAEEKSVVEEYVELID